MKRLAGIRTWWISAAGWRLIRMHNMKRSTLKREFEERLQSDESFAKNPGARLNFFYRRSPYWDAALNVYPVARLTDQAILDRVE